MPGEVRAMWMWTSGMLTLNEAEKAVAYVNVPDAFCLYQGPPTSVTGDNSNLRCVWLKIGQKNAKDSFEMALMDDPLRQETAGRGALLGLGIQSMAVTDVNVPIPHLQTRSVLK
jgi:hypothetical protein